MSKTAKYQGFSFIELLTTMAILVLLAAMLIPVIYRATEKAHQSMCLSQIRQFGQATMLYVQDNDDNYPLSLYSSGSCVKTFGTLIMPYAKSKNLSQCPAEPQAMDVNTIFSNYGGACPETPAFASYTVNNSLMPQGAAGVQAVSVGAVPYPVQTIMGYDGNVAYGIAPQPLKMAQPVQGRHNSSFNATYADGHAKAIPVVVMGGAWQIITNRPLRIYKIGPRGGFYSGKFECQSMP